MHDTNSITITKPIMYDKAKGKKGKSRVNPKKYFIYLLFRSGCYRNFYIGSDIRCIKKIHTNT